MNVSMRTDIKIDKDKMQKIMLTRAGRALVRAASYVRKVARSSIKRSSESSAPGTPPNSRTGTLKRSILYALADDRKSVFIGPSFREIADIGGLHESGGIRITETKPRVYKIWEKGPIFEKTGAIRVRDLTHVVLETPAMVKRANELSEKYTKKHNKGKYPARPFIGPAFEKSKPRILEFFSNPK